MSSEFNYPSLPQSHFEHFKVRGHEKCLSACYSTRENVLTGVIVEAIRSELHADSLVDCIQFPALINVASARIQFHFLENRPSMVFDDAARPMQGSYIRFTVPIMPTHILENLSPSTLAMQSIERCASMLSLMHGEFVALERHIAVETDLNSGQYSIESETVTVRQTYSTDYINDKLASIIDHTRNCNIINNKVAKSLISRSHHEKSDTLKFLFLWLSIEAILGNGKKREKFALETMKSEFLNNLIKEFHDIRGKILHDGEEIKLEQLQYIKLKCVVLLSLCGNDKLRVCLLNFLENSPLLDSGGAGGFQS